MTCRVLLPWLLFEVLWNEVLSIPTIPGECCEGWLEGSARLLPGPDLAWAGSSASLLTPFLPFVCRAGAVARFSVWTLQGKRGWSLCCKFYLKHILQVAEAFSLEQDPRLGMVVWGRGRRVVFKCIRAWRGCSAVWVQRPSAATVVAFRFWWHWWHSLDFPGSPWQMVHVFVGFWAE